MKIGPLFGAPVPRFWTFGVPPPRTNGPVARPHGGILKKPTSGSSSACGLGDREKKWYPTLRMTEPQPCNGQNGRFCPTRDVFQQYRWGSVIRRSVGCHFSSGSPRPHAELELEVGFFQNSSVGASYGAIRTGRWRPDRLEIGNDYVKKGGFSLSPQNIHFFNLKFDGDSDSAIKHDLIPWTDQVLGVQHWLKTRWGAKISM